MRRGRGTPKTWIRRQVRDSLIEYGLKPYKADQWKRMLFAVGVERAIEHPPLYDDSPYRKAHFQIWGDLVQPGKEVRLWTYMATSRDPVFKGKAFKVGRTRSCTKRRRALKQVYKSISMIAIVPHFIVPEPALLRFLWPWGIDDPEVRNRPGGSEWFVDDLFVRATLAEMVRLQQGSPTEYRQYRAYTRKIFKWVRYGG